MKNWIIAGIILGAASACTAASSESPVDDWKSSCPDLQMLSKDDIVSVWACDKTSDGKTSTVVYQYLDQHGKFSYSAEEQKANWMKIWKRTFAEPFIIDQGATWIKMENPKLVKR